MMNPGIELVTFLVGWIGFQLIAEIVVLFLAISIPDSEYMLLILNYVSYGILFALILSFTFKFLPKLLKNCFRKETLFGLLVFVVILIFDMEWGRFISAFDTSENINQETVATLIDQSPLLAIIFTGLIAPFCEEMTYRAGLFSFTKRVNRVLAYIAVSFIFAFIHMHDITSLNEWLNFPPYVFAGLAFSFAYEKWGLGASLLAHVSNNIIAVLLSIIV